MEPWNISRVNPLSAGPLYIQSLLIPTANVSGTSGACDDQKVNFLPNYSAVSDSVALL